MSSDWGTNVGIFLVAIAASFVVVSVVRSGFERVGSLSLGGELLGLVLGLAAFFAVLLVAARLFRFDDASR